MSRKRKRLTWQEEEEIDRQAWIAHAARRDGLWNVPEDARDAYIEMEDSFGPETVNAFVKAAFDALIREAVRDILQEIKP